MLSSVYPDQVTNRFFYLSFFRVINRLGRFTTTFGTWIFPVNTHTCSDLRCHKYFLSTVLDSFIDLCTGAKFKTLEMPKWHGAEFYQHCNTIILCVPLFLCVFFKINPWPVYHWLSVVLPVSFSSIYVCLSCLMAMMSSYQDSELHCGEKTLAR